MTYSYVPILKTKRAEFTALNQLNATTKSKIIPLLEIEPVPIDPDTELPAKSYDDFLANFGQKIATATDDIDMVYLDGLLIESQFISPADIYPITNAVTQVRAAGVHVIPVSSPTRDMAYRNAVDTLIQGEICLRLTIADLANPQLLMNYISHLGIPFQNIDIVIDLRDTVTEDNINLGTQQTLTSGFINNLPHLSDYRRVILSSGSFPTDLTNIPVGSHRLQRLEWTLWQDLYRSKTLERFVLFSDYGIQHPDYTRLPTRFPSVSASVRYTVDDDFLILRGRKANQYGFEQYGKHSQDIVNHPDYAGQHFSAADLMIHDYAQTYAAHLQNSQPNPSFGSAETWRKIGQDHHITKVVDQLASLYGL
ncbi:beta family protein [Tatumella saanichensis]|uniref:beta family protein n=1 Tax=Tatumella saanichensis TaxID=480813 RepID=UPI0004A31616|nr:beta family protein [Tatumella saanichensis]